MRSIYPASLILNKENERDDSAHVLDLDIHLVNGVCELKLYYMMKGRIFPLILCSMCILVAMFLGVFYTGYLGLR